MLLFAAVVFRTLLHCIAQCTLGRTFGLRALYNIRVVHIDQSDALALPPQEAHAAAPTSNSHLLFNLHTLNSSLCSLLLLSFTHKR